MNITDAAHKTVKDYPGGSEALAVRIGMSAAVLRNKVNPNNNTHHLTLAEASEVMGVTGDDRILHAMAAEHGYTLQKMQADSMASVMGAMLENAAKQGAFAQALQEALSDGLISENEMKAISSAGTAQVEAMINLLARLRAVTGQRGVGA
ncbi:phage regulatory CII family protein [Stenotrophomonas maltophilia]|uniref:phage regulatory CII family protein n=1 Tax=Stenotrophomonas maltophilia TaxID=40324 RepID=UPI0013DB05C6|nr:phage regulatory CII family protein [Stenotrophomonas maltophilia]MBH1591422.1 phage regulatory CII family protein [Stenotrophomonas maltophilia]